MLVIISTSYFIIKNQKNFRLIKKYWWKNAIIQKINYRNMKCLLVTTGRGKANAAMIATYLIEKYNNIKTVLNIDFALSTRDSLKTGDITLSTKFIYRDVDQTIFNEIKYGQVVNESESFQFSGDIVQKVKNFNLGLFESVIGTGDMLIYNTKQFKEMVEKFEDSIDVIDEEAGSLAQVFKKTRINFLSIKVIYNNTLSPWEDDPNHVYKMYEVTNTFRYLIKRILNFFASKISYFLEKTDDNSMHFICKLLEFNGDKWIKRIFFNASEMVYISPEKVLLLNKAKDKLTLIDFATLFIKSPNKKESDKEYAKIFLGEDEWKYSMSKWENKYDLLQKVNVNDKELLLNQATNYYKKTKNFLSFKNLADNILKIINEKKLNIGNTTYKNNSIDNNALVICVNANLTFYISKNSNHELIEDYKLGKSILKNAIIKQLNETLKNENMPNNKIHIYVYFKGLFNKTIQLFIDSKSNKDKPINFGKVNTRLEDIYSIVDNTDQYNKDSFKVGDFKNSIKLNVKDH